MAHVEKETSANKIIGVVVMIAIVATTLIFLVKGCGDKREEQTLLLKEVQVSEVLEDTLYVSKDTTIQVKSEVLSGWIVITPEGKKKYTIDIPKGVVINMIFEDGSVWEYSPGFNSKQLVGYYCIDAEREAVGFYGRWRQVKGFGKRWPTFRVVPNRDTTMKITVS